MSLKALGYDHLHWFRGQTAYQDNLCSCCHDSGHIYHCTKHVFVSLSFRDKEELGFVGCKSMNFYIFHFGRTDRISNIENSVIFLWNQLYSPGWPTYWLSFCINQNRHISNAILLWNFNHPYPLIESGIFCIECQHHLGMWTLWPRFPNSSQLQGVICVANLWQRFQLSFKCNSYVIGLNLGG